MSMENRVVVTRASGVAVITINRPQAANAIDDVMAGTIGAALEEAHEDPDVGAVVIAATGDRTFSAGTDLRALPTRAVSEVGNRGTWNFAGVVRHPIDKPLVAAVNGAAVGGGAEIVLAADLAVAGESAYLQFPEARIGLYAGAGGAFRLAAAAGDKRAMAALLLGEPITASEALSWGLVNAVVADGAERDEALRLATKIAELPRASVAATLRISRAARQEWDDAGWAASIDELGRFDIAASTGDLS